MNKKVSLLKLFWIFFKIGLVLFGGGYAILPFLQAEIVEKEKICTQEQMIDYYALAQCVPGIVAGSVSMFIGYSARSILGALACIFGMCLPAFIAMIIFAAMLGNISHYPLIQSIFNEIGIAVCVLIFLTIAELWKKSVKDFFTWAIFVVSIVATLLFQISPFWVIILSGIFGVLVKLLRREKNAD